MKDQTTKKFLAIMAILAMVLCAVVIGVFVYTPMTEIDLKDRYNAHKEAAICFEVFDKANVRAEPIVMQDSDGESNSFGEIKQTGFTVKVSKVYKTDTQLDENGAFYGFSVKEIRETSEGKDYFPKKIKKDPDGIVWINSKYIEVYPSTPQ